MKTVGGIAILGGLLAAATFAVGQPPDNRGPEGRPRGDRFRGDRGEPQGREGGFVVRMLAFDKNGDGTLTKEEVADDRLVRLFDRADADKDGNVTKDELTALERQEQETYGRGGFGGPGGGGPGREFGPPNGQPGRRGFGPPGGGPGGPGGPPRPGDVLAGRIREDLGLTADQEEQIEALQKEVDAKLDQILNEDQRRQLKEMREFGPGRPPGEFGGPGGPDDDPDGPGPRRGGRSLTDGDGRRRPPE